MLYTLYVGSYSDGKTEGIRSFSVDSETGKATLLAITPVENPSYLALSPDECFLYAVGESSGENAKVYAFKREERGKLTLIGTRPALGGSPCHVAVAKNGSFLVVSNYHGGNLVLYGLQEDGRFRGNESTTFSLREPEAKVSRMHSAQFSPDGHYVVVANLGLDCLFRFYVLEDVPVNFLDFVFFSVTRLSKGDGPRHTVFHPSGKYIYCVNELSGKISVFEVKNSRTKEELIPVCETDPEEGERSGAAIRISGDGNFLYASFRSPSGRISIFSIDHVTRKLTRLGQIPAGVHPRDFDFSPDGRFLFIADRDSDAVILCEIDKKTGVPRDIGRCLEAPKATSIVFASSIL